MTDANKRRNVCVSVSIVGVLTGFRIGSVSCMMDSLPLKLTT